MSEPPNVIWALPFAPVLGVVVRSPVSVLIGRPFTLPIVVSSRCTLLTFLVVWLDCLSRVDASGSGAPLCFGLDEQPATNAAATLRMPSRVTKDGHSRRRGRDVCIPCIVEGVGDCG